MLHFHLKLVILSRKKLLPLYKQVFNELAAAGATYIQVDEPIFVTDEVLDFRGCEICLFLFCKGSAEVKIISNVF